MQSSHMIRLILAFTFLGCAAAFAQLRVGVVRMDAIFLDDPEKLAYSEKAQAQIKAISNNERKNNVQLKAQEFQMIDAEVKKLIKSFEDLPTETQKADATKKIQELGVERGKKQTALQSAMQDYEEFQKKETQALNQEMALKMRSILNNIIVHVTKVAKEKDLDYVFETSGNTNTGISVFAFIKKESVIDITEDVLKELKRIK
jgi:Skp family chaperone for outer membrane proteins